MDTFQKRARQQTCGESGIRTIVNFAAMLAIAIAATLATIALIS